MKKFCVWFGLLMSTAVFTACGTGIKNSSESSSSSVSMQTQNIEMENNGFGESGVRSAGLYALRKLSERRRV